MLCAYAILENGKKVLLHLALGSTEPGSVSSIDMTARGLEEPLLVIADKHKGLKKAAIEVFSHAFKQPCLSHKMRNILCKLPKKVEKEMKELVHHVLPQKDAQSYEEGLRLGHELIARFRDRHPSAIECLEEDLEECLTYLKFPQAHWRAIRTSNLLERTFGEGRRRTKVIPRFPTESSALRLLYATLITASQSWRGIRMTPDIWWELELLRREAFGESSQVVEKELAAV